MNEDFIKYLNQKLYQGQKDHNEFKNKLQSDPGFVEFIFNKGDFASKGKTIDDFRKELNITSSSKANTTTSTSTPNLVSTQKPLFTPSQLRINLEQENEEFARKPENLLKSNTWGARGGRARINKDVSYQKLVTDKFANGELNVLDYSAEDLNEIYGNKDHNAKLRQQAKEAKKDLDIQRNDRDPIKDAFAKWTGGAFGTLDTNDEGKINITRGMLSPVNQPDIYLTEEEILGMQYHPLSVKVDRSGKKVVDKNPNSFHNKHLRNIQENLVSSEKMNFAAASTGIFKKIELTGSNLKNTEKKLEGVLGKGGLGKLNALSQKIQEEQATKQEQQEFENLLQKYQNSGLAERYEELAENYNGLNEEIKGLKEDPKYGKYKQLEFLKESAHIQNNTRRKQMSKTGRVAEDISSILTNLPDKAASIPKDVIQGVGVLTEAITGADLGATDAVFKEAYRNAEDIFSSKQTRGVRDKSLWLHGFEYVFDSKTGKAKEIYDKDGYVLTVDDITRGELLNAANEAYANGAKLKQNTNYEPLLHGVTQTAPDLLLMLPAGGIMKAGLKSLGKAATKVERVNRVSKWISNAGTNIAESSRLAEAGSLIPVFVGQTMEDAVKSGKISTPRELAAVTGSKLALETIAEAMFAGPVGKLLTGKGWTQKALSEGIETSLRETIQHYATGKITNADFLRAARKATGEFLGTNGILGEGIEEALVSAVEPLVNDVLNQALDVSFDNTEVDFDEVESSFLVGAVAGSTMSGPQMFGELWNYKGDTKEYYKNKLSDIVANTTEARMKNDTIKYPEAFKSAMESLVAKKHITPEESIKYTEAINRASKETEYLKTPKTSGLDAVLGLADTESPEYAFNSYVRNLAFDVARAELAATTETNEYGKQVQTQVVQERKQALKELEKNHYHGVFSSKTPSIIALEKAGRAFTDQEFTELKQAHETVLKEVGASKFNNRNKTIAFEHKMQKAINNILVKSPVTTEPEKVKLAEEAKKIEENTPIVNAEINKSELKAGNSAETLNPKQQEELSAIEKADVDSFFNEIPLISTATGVSLPMDDINELIKENPTQEEYILQKVAELKGKAIQKNVANQNTASTTTKGTAEIGVKERYKQSPQLKADEEQLSKSQYKASLTAQLQDGLDNNMLPPDEIAELTNKINSIDNTSMEDLYKDPEYKAILDNITKVSAPAAKATPEQAVEAKKKRGRPKKIAETPKPLIEESEFPTPPDPTEESTFILSQANLDIPPITLDDVRVNIEDEAPYIEPETNQGTPDEVLDTVVEPIKEAPVEEAKVEEAKDKPKHELELDVPLNATIDDILNLIAGDTKGELKEVVSGTPFMRNDLDDYIKIIEHAKEGDPIYFEVGQTRTLKVVEMVLYFDPATNTFVKKGKGTQRMVVGNLNSLLNKNTQAHIIAKIIESGGSDLISTINDAVLARHNSEHYKTDNPNDVVETRHITMEELKILSPYMYVLGKPFDSDLASDIGTMEGEDIVVLEKTIAELEIKWQDRNYPKIDPITGKERTTPPPPMPNKGKMINILQGKDDQGNKTNKTEGKVIILIDNQILFLDTLKIGDVQNSLKDLEKALDKLENDNKGAKLTYHFQHDEVLKKRSGVQSDKANLEKANVRGRLLEVYKSKKDNEKPFYKLDSANNEIYFTRQEILDELKNIRVHIDHNSLQNPTDEYLEKLSNVLTVTVRSTFPLIYPSVQAVVPFKKDKNLNTTTQKTSVTPVEAVAQVNDTPPPSKEDKPRRKTKEEDISYSIEPITSAPEVDPNLQKTYFNDGFSTTVSETLDKIANSTSPLNVLARRLQKYAAINNITLYLDDVAYYESETNPNLKGAGYYDSAKNEIRIAKNSKHRQGRGERLLLHEILHALSYHELRKKGQYTNDFYKLYEAAIAKLGTYDPKTKEGEYGTYTIDEFFVAIFTDSKFIKELQQIPPTKGINYLNLFDEIVNYLLGLLGIKKKDSLYTQAVSVASYILEDQLINGPEAFDEAYYEGLEAMAFSISDWNDATSYKHAKFLSNNIFNVYLMDKYGLNNINEILAEFKDVTIDKLISDFKNQSEDLKNSWFRYVTDRNNLDEEDIMDFTATLNDVFEQYKNDETFTTIVDRQISAYVGGKATFDELGEDELASENSLENSDEVVEDESDTEDVQTGISEHTKNQAHTDSRTRASKRLREFFGKLHVATFKKDNGKASRSNVRDPYLYFPEYYEGELIHNKLLNELSDSVSYQDMINKINELPKKYIWGVDVIAEVLKLNAEQTIEAIDNNTLVIPSDILNNPDSYKANTWLLKDLYYAIADQTNQNKIKLVNAPGNQEGRFSNAVTNNDLENTIEAIKDRLKSLSTTERESLLTRITELKDNLAVGKRSTLALKKFFEQIGYSVSTPFLIHLGDNSSTFVEKGKTISNNDAFLSILLGFSIALKNNNLRQADNEIKKLAKLLNTYENSSSNLSFLNIKNELEFAHVPQGFLKRQFTALKNNINEWIQSKTSFVSNNDVLFHRWLSLYEDIKNFSYDIFEDGFVTTEGQSFGGKEYKDYSGIDLIINSLNAFAASITGEGGSGINVKGHGLFHFGVFSDSPKRVILRAPVFKKGEVIDRMVSTVYGELERIRLHAKGSLTKFKNLSENGGIFHAIPELNDVQVKYAGQESYVPLTNYLSGWENNSKNSIAPQISEIIVDGIPQDIDNFNGKSYHTAMNNVVAEIINTYYTRYLDDLYNKKLIGRVQGDEFFRPENSKIYKEIFNGSTLQDFYYNKFYNNVITQIVFAGDPASYGKNKFNNLTDSNIVKRFKQLISPTIRKAVADKTNPITGERSTNLDILIIKDVEVDDSTFDGQSSLSDGGAYHTIARRKELIKADPSMDQSLLGVLDRLDNGTYKQEDLDKIFQPIKPFLFTNILERTPTGEIISIPIQLKNSEVLLLPSIAYEVENQGTFVRPRSIKEIHENNYVRPELAKILFLMETNNVDIAVYDTASKAETFGIVDIDEITDDNADLRNAADYRLTTLQLSDWGEQMAVPEHHFDSKIRDGIQVGKIMTANVDPTFSFTLDGKEYKGLEGVNELISLIQVNDINFNLDKTLNKISDKDGTISNDKIIKLISDKLIDEQPSVDTIQGLKIQSDGRPLVPLELLGQKIQQSLNAMFKKIPVFKSKGASFVNQPSVGFIDRANEIYQRGSFRDNLKMVTDVDNNNNTVIKHWEAMVPVYDPIIYQYIDSKGNLLLDENKKPLIPEEYLHAFLYRIPTEDKYSTYHIKIVKFLPQAQGGTIILPREATSMTGLDFDVDKLYGFFYNHEDGEAVKSSLTSDKGRQNLKLDIYIKLSQTKAFYNSATTPGNKKRLVKLRNELAPKPSSRSFADPLQESENAIKNIVGKKLVGIFANANAFYNMIQGVVTLQLKKKLFITIGEATYEFNSIGAPLEDISRDIAELLFASTEDVKDPVLAPLNINETTSNLLIFLLSATNTSGGKANKMSFENAIKFINQPQVLLDVERATQGNKRLTEIGSPFNHIYKLSEAYGNIIINSKIDAEIGPNFYSVTNKLQKIDSVFKSISSSGQYMGITNAQDVLPDGAGSSKITKLNTLRTALETEIAAFKQLFSFLSPSITNIVKEIGLYTKNGVLSEKLQHKVSYYIYDAAIANRLDRDVMLNELDITNDFNNLSNFEGESIKLRNALQLVDGKLQMRPLAVVGKEALRDLKYALSALFETNPEFAEKLATNMLMSGTGFSITSATKLIPNAYWTTPTGAKMRRLLTMEVSSNIDTHITAQHIILNHFNQMFRKVDDTELAELLKEEFDRSLEEDEGQKESYVWNQNDAGKQTLYQRGQYGWEQVTEKAKASKPNYILNSIPVPATPEIIPDIEFNGEPDSSVDISTLKIITIEPATTQEYQDFRNSELEKNPYLTEEEIEEHYKKCRPDESL